MGINKIFTLLSLLLTLNLSAMETAQSLEWQRASLEEKITHKVKSALNAIITNKQYIVDVSILTTTPNKPDFNLPRARQPRKIKFNNKKSPSEGGDYILFSKFGIEAPIMSAMEKMEPRKKSNYEYLWKYNQSMNIYNNIDEVSIKVSLSDKLMDSTRENVKKILETINFSLGDASPVIAIDYMNLDFKIKKNPVTPIKKEKLEKNLWKEISKFSNTIGLVLATLILGIVAFILFNRYEKLKEKEAQNQAHATMANAPQEVNEEKEDQKEKTEGIVSDGMNETSHLSGIERFSNFLDKSPVDTAFLVKKWIKGGSSDEIEALLAITDQLENDRLIEIFNHITLADRENWKEILIENEGRNISIEKANQFISKEIVGDIIVPKIVNDAELCDMILNIKEQQAAKFIKDHEELGVTLLNLVNNKYVLNIFKELDQEVVERVMIASYEETEEVFNTNIKNLKSAMTPYLIDESKEKSTERVLSLIPSSNRSTEYSLYRVLFTKAKKEEIQRVAVDYIPFELIDSLPTEIIAKTFGLYSVRQRTEILYSIQDMGRRELLLNTFAEEGTTVRDMMNLEFEKFEESFNLRKYVQENREDIWGEFVNNVRLIVRNSGEYSEEISTIISNWIDTKSGPLKPIAESA